MNLKSVSKLNGPFEGCRAEPSAAADSSKPGVFRSFDGSKEQRMYYEAKNNAITLPLE
jgi:hypothetical protein